MVRATVRTITLQAFVHVDDETRHPASAHQVYKIEDQPMRRFVLRHAAEQLACTTHGNVVRRMDRPNVAILRNTYPLMPAEAPLIQVVSFGVRRAKCSSGPISASRVLDAVHMETSMSPFRC